MDVVKYRSGNYNLLQDFRDAHKDNRLVIMTEEDLVTLGIEDRPLRELDPKEDRLYDFAFDNDGKLLGALTYFFLPPGQSPDATSRIRLCQVSTREGYKKRGIATELC